MHQKTSGAHEKVFGAHVKVLRDYEKNICVKEKNVNSPTCWCDRVKSRRATGLSY